MPSLDEWGSRFDKDPLGTSFSAALRVGCGVIILGMLFGAVGWSMGWFSSAAKVVQQEFNPDELLRKYSWFKDAAAMLDKKVADITVYDGRVKRMRSNYGDTPRQKWARSDLEQINVWESEVAGIKASYNSLAAEYNSNMAKFQWRFCEVGKLPQGATVPLPREYKPYQSE